MQTTSASPKYKIEIIFDLPEIINSNLRYKQNLISIEDILFMRESAVNIDYSPYYQRNYVWDIIKATFFIESLLLNTEIPPLITFKSGRAVEIIDGRQRYETILRFINGEFKLSSKGLVKLKHLASKNFYSMGDGYVKALMRIQLRMYEYELHNNVKIDDTVEVILKQEIFKRYNTGITPLTQLEIFKAKYINDVLNNYFKNELEKDKTTFTKIAGLFNIQRPNIQILLKTVRDLLVLHTIPIYSYTNRKSEIDRFYEDFSGVINENDGPANMYKHFLLKLNFLQDIKTELISQSISINGLVFKSLFWALSICQREKVPQDKLKNLVFKKKMIVEVAKISKKYAAPTIQFTQMARSIFNSISLFFENNISVDFDPYIRSSDESKKKRALMRQKSIEKEDALISNQASLLKKEPSCVTLSTLIRRIAEKAYDIRPAYQRKDVINRAKSSSIIESLLLGIELPPIFIFKRKNGQQEVIDGQQRLISCIAFLGSTYKDENGTMVKSQRSGFALNLKDGILKELDGRRFANLDTDSQSKIQNAVIHIVEINEESNPSFDPVDLFMRLNFKPYPIRENSFESWNSFVDKEVIDRIKEIRKNNKEWLFLTPKNERMHDEELITTLIYFQLKCGGNFFSLDKIKECISFSIIHGFIAIRIINKADITKTLIRSNADQAYLDGANQLEQDFIFKVKILLGLPNEHPDNGLAEILNSKSGGKVRTYFRFYVLWIALSGIPKTAFQSFAPRIKQDLIVLFNRLIKIKRVETFESQLQILWQKYEKGGQS